MALCSAFSASCHWSGAPSYLPLAPPSQVDSSASYSSKPKVFSVSAANSRQLTISSSIWSGVQKICASSWVKPRTRISPCMVPERS